MKIEAYVRFDVQDVYCLKVDLLMVIYSIISEWQKLYNDIAKKWSGYIYTIDTWSCHITT